VPQQFVGHFGDIAHVDGVDAQCPRPPPVMLSGVTDAAGAHPHQQVTFADLRHRHVLSLKRIGRNRGGLVQA